MKPHAPTGYAMVGLWHACIAGRLMMAAVAVLIEVAHPGGAKQSASAWPMIDTHVTMFLAITALLAALVFMFEPIRRTIAPASSSIVCEEHKEEHKANPSGVVCGIIASWYVSLAGCLSLAGHSAFSWAGVYIVVTVFLVMTTLSVAVVCCGLVARHRRIIGSAACIPAAGDSISIITEIS